MTLLARPWPRRLMINSTAIFAGEASTRLATLFVAIAVARSHGPMALGQYGYAVAVASVLLLIPDAGLHLCLVRELAADPGRLGPLFWGVNWLKLPLVVAVLTFSILWGEFVIHDAGRRVLLYLLTARVVLQTFSQAYMAVFKAFERMHFVAAQQFANTLLVAVWVGAAWWANASVTLVVLALVAGQALEMWIGWRIVRRDFVPGRPNWEGVADLGSMLMASLPVGAAAILLALDLRLDILTLSPFASDRALGTFQAAAWFPVGAFLSVSLLMTALFPKLARHLRSPGAVGNRYVESLLKNGVLLMAAASVLVWLFAPHLLRLLFGEGVVPAVAALRVLVVALPCVFINTVMFHVFVAARRHGAYLTALVLGILLGAPLSLLLSARLGANGTALADVLREVFVSFVYLCFLKAGNFGQSAARSLLKVLACATALIVPTGLLPGFAILGRGAVPAWVVGWLAWTVAFMGWPRLREMLLLADDDL